MARTTDKAHAAAEKEHARVIKQGLGPGWAKVFAAEAFDKALRNK